MSAKNPNNLSKFIGVTYIRKADTDGEFVELASARATISSIDTQAKSVDVITDTRGSVIQGDIPVNKIDLSFLENASADALSLLLGVDKVSVAGGAIALVDVPQTFSSADKIELNYQSNDNLGVTSVAVKSSDGVTTYVLDTDYSLALANNRTVITNLGAGIASGATVAVSGSYNANASEQVTIESKYRNKDVFEVKIEAIDESTGTNHYRVVTLDQAVLSSVYNLEFLDVVKAGDINGTQATFEGLEGASLTYKDEIL